MPHKSCNSDAEFGAEIMHHRAVFAHQEGMRAGDGEIVGALDAVGAGDVDNAEAAIVGGFDALAGRAVRSLILERMRNSAILGQRSSSSPASARSPSALPFA